MNSEEREQAFLDEVYRKARLLEYDKREAEKVRHNHRILARQRWVKVAVVLGSTVSAAGMSLYGEINEGICILVSLLLFGAGMAVERFELSWNADKRTGSGSN
ncbi:hypothetical protein [Paenibacillus tepidiphilus]|uniref:hypothetical protein n=1 Tax=Paenibacillus tepidiphilus TaxID=2608683 RepID=UPI00123BF61E|nr:hypothetical protein [Paenibacillus tepidiphilus]